MQTASAPSIDAVFHALAHPARRAMVVRLGGGPAAVSVLAAPLGLSLPTITEHLRVLERSGVVRSRKRGRVRTYELSPAPLAAAEGWLAAQRSLWERRLDQLDAFLTSVESPDEPA